MTAEKIPASCFRAAPPPDMDRSVFSEVKSLEPKADVRLLWKASELADSFVKADGFFSVDGESVFKVVEEVNSCGIMMPFEESLDVRGHLGKRSFLDHLSHALSREEFVYARCIYRQGSAQCEKEKSEMDRVANMGIFEYAWECAYAIYNNVSNGLSNWIGKISSHKEEDGK